MNNTHTVKVKSSAISTESAIEFHSSSSGRIIHQSRLTEWEQRNLFSKIENWLRTGVFYGRGK